MDASCCCQNDSDIISLIADIADIFVAVCTLGLAIYVFGYERAKHRRDARLQWFKELIIEPNKSVLYGFFSEIQKSTQGFKSYQLIDTTKLQILEDIKDKCSRFRKDFIILLRPGDEALEQDIQKNVDDMLDTITRNIFDANFNLNSDAEFNIHIDSVIAKTKLFVFSRIFTFEG
jgi:hypothetical protein